MPNVIVVGSQWGDEGKGKIVDFLSASFQDLPLAVQAYLQKIEKLCGVPISMVSVGPERRQTVVLKRVFKEADT